MKKGIISDSQGPYRAYRNPVITRTAKDGILKFWCMGHEDKILDLLHRMPAVGKKVSMGFGVIDSINIQECAEDYSLYHPEYGLMRPVPVEDAEGLDFDITKYPVFRYGVKPPYWKPCNARLCYVPVRL